MCEKVKCESCETEEAQSQHACPYEEDVKNNPDDKYCNCCASCRQQCAMDI